MSVGRQKRTASTAQQIQNLVGEIQKILGKIAGTGEPASQLEIAELRALGETYAKLTDKMARETTGNGPDRT